MKVAVIIPAAGSSRRYAEASMEGGVGRSKLDEDLGGRPVLQRTVEVFTKRPEVAMIVVAGPADPAAMAEFRTRHGDKLGLLGVRVCVGGKDHRYETVRNALAEIPAEADVTHVAVHDAARPCVSEALLDRLFEAAAKFPAVIPALDVADTLKRVDPEPIQAADADPLAAILGDAGRTTSKVRRVEATVDRTNLVAVQTPQVFEIGLLRRAYAQSDLSSTDDAQLVERLGERVVVVQGEATNIKITRPADLGLARQILGVRGPQERPVHKRF